MGTTAECREQLERHLQKFRDVADERMREKVGFDKKWGEFFLHFPCLMIRVHQKFCSHIFGLIFFFISTLYLSCDSIASLYWHVAERSNYISTQTSNAITAKV
jgi:hypothetical protein